MYFTKVELHNFGIYKGTHEMRLTDKEDQRNITLVGGMNGRGKTTFHDAILIALYGKQALKYINEKARSYDKLLLEHINKQATDKEAYVAVSIVLDDGTHLRVKRSWTAKGAKAEQHISVEKDGAIDKYLGENWNYYIEEILPFSIARFFFFNNEKITQLADDDSFEQIKAAIKTAIGISTIEKAINHADEVIHRNKRAMEVFEKSEINVGYQEIDAQLTDVEQKLAEATEKAHTLEETHESLIGAIETKEKEFWALGGNLNQNKTAIMLEIQSLSSEIERIRNRIFHLTADTATPLFMCRDLVNRSYESEVKLKNKEILFHASKIVSDYHKQIMDGLDKLNLNKGDLRSIKDLICDVLAANSPQKTELTRSTPSHHVSASTMALYQRLISEVFPSLAQQIATLVSQEDTQERQRISLESHLTAVEEEPLAKQLFDTLKSLEADRAIIEAEWKQQEEAIVHFTRQRETLKAKRLQLIKAVAEKENANDDRARTVKYAAMSIVVLDKFKVQLQREKVSKLSHMATECFCTLVSKDSLIRSIHIDPDTLNVTMWGADGKELLKTQLSAGEQQMFAISIVWALALTSGYKAPVIIDTPMARLDSSNRANFVTKYLPVASSQVVILSTDEEINGRYLDMIRDNVVSYYTLRYNEEEQYTSITSGYFQEG